MESKIEVREKLAQLPQEEQQALLQEGPQGKSSGGLNLICMEDVQEQAVNWLWYPYIPAGKLTILQGDPGGGKTTFSLQLASIITNGGYFPAGDSSKQADMGAVIFQTAEDGLGDTVKPRLREAGANMSKVFVIDESSLPLELVDCRIEQAIAAKQAKLLIIDPLQAYLGKKVDMHRANEVRPIMSHLSHVAERTGCAIVLICHMNKGNAKGLYRGLGSIDIAAAARSMLILGQDPNNQYIRAVAQVKSSLAPNGKTIAFELNPELGFLWRGETELTVEDILGAPQGSNGAENGVLEEAKHIMLELFDEQSEWLAADITNQLKQSGVSQRTIDRAKAELQIQSFSTGFGKEKKWFWRLPALDCQTPKNIDDLAVYGEKPHDYRVCAYSANGGLRDRNTPYTANGGLSKNVDITAFPPYTAKDGVSLGNWRTKDENILLRGEL